jgi:nitroreductase
MTKQLTVLNWINNAERIIRERQSIRGFDGSSITPEQKAALLAALETGRNPFKSVHRFIVVESENGSGEALKLGTYGIIKGAKQYLISAMTPGDEHLEALGFDMEYAVLHAQSEGLGTCWLGGTFNKGQFATALGLKNGEMLPIVIPFGKPAAKDGLMGRLIRNLAGSNNRFAFEELFSNEEYGKPLSMADAGPFAMPLEMVRLGPSASNKQPWRVVKEGNTVHFYLKPNKGYSKSLGYDIQRVDLGIAVCHFDAMAQAQGIEGHFQKLNGPQKEERDDLSYIISFVAK